MAQRDVNARLTDADMAKAQKRIQQVREELGFNIGDDITYELLQKALVWVNSRITYEYDDVNYGEVDMWNTQAFWWLMVDDYLIDDCDGTGYVFIGFLIYVFKMPREKVYRVMCKTETGGGHFVCWGKASDGIMYQLENRLRRVRTLRYMHDFGYVYMHYSDMTPANISKDKLYNAEQKVMREIYNTPLDHPANEPNPTFTQVLANTGNSKTLKFTIIDKVLTTGAGIFGAMATVNDWRIIALIGLYGLIGAGIYFYIRGVTFKPMKDL